MMRSFALCLCLAATFGTLTKADTIPAPRLTPDAPLNAWVTVTIRDGNPWDKITILNRGCAPLTGRLTIDMRNSAGEMLIDTLRGGPGTKDPMPVKVLKGPLRTDAVADGDQQITILMGGIAAGTRAEVGLDLDNTTGWWPAPRVEVWGEHIVGSRASLALRGVSETAVFGPDGRATLGRQTTCARPVAPVEDLTPIS